MRVNDASQPSGDVRLERDTMGDVAVPADRLWGAQTQRSLANFDIGRDTFVWGRPMIHALGLLKQAAAEANKELGVLPPALADRIATAAAEVALGDHDGEFPLVVFQTGSGTQSNMNANEVIANRAIQLAGGVLGSKDPVHPNDHVNKGQSSNDTFPTAMHIAVVLEVESRLVPAVMRLRNVLSDVAHAHADVVMVGRTHLQDATPIMFAQVVGSWVAQLDDALATIVALADGVRALAIGGTAVGTGLGTHPEFGRVVASRLCALTGTDFWQAAMAAHDGLASLSGGLRTLGAALMKIANDVRWYASGPRTGIGEMSIPENEPGSSIMPGKVNPTQSEALTMVVARVFGNDATVGFAATQGNFQLNVFKPVMAHAVLESIRLLSDGSESFAAHCATGLAPITTAIAAHLADDLMLVTGLAPHLGYDAAAAIAKQAQRDGVTLRDAALASGLLTAAQFDAWVVPADMTHPRA